MMIKKLGRIDPHLYHASLECYYWFLSFSERLRKYNP